MLKKKCDFLDKIIHLVILFFMILQLQKLCIMKLKTVGWYREGQAERQEDDHTFLL
jgi:hypothetical protein